MKPILLFMFVLMCQQTLADVKLETNKTSASFLQLPFSTNEPVIKCAPIHACDITLETGENILGIYTGDSLRWLYEQAMSGCDGQQQMHVIFKPKEVGIETNAVITTDRRTYHLALKSDPNHTVSSVSFLYPEIKKGTYESSDNERFDVSKLDFNYSVHSDWFASKLQWAPTQVFNDGVHTYILMPKKHLQTIPVLFIVGENNATKLTNVRISDHFYIVDELFQKALMVSGNGVHAKRIVIKHFAVRR